MSEVRKRRYRRPCKNCGDLFQPHPRRPAQIFCDVICGKEHWNRQRRAQNRELLKVVRNESIDPKHYKNLDPEPIVVIDGWKLNFNLGNALSYIARCDHKGTRRADLIKAANYCFREATGRWLPKEVLNASPGPDLLAGEPEEAGSGAPGAKSQDMS